MNGITNGVIMDKDLHKLTYKNYWMLLLTTTTTIAVYC